MKGVNVTKKEQRKLRKTELQRLTVEELGKILPFVENAVTATLPDPNNVKKPSKAEMIETILARELPGSQYE
jgi:hypothetical protein